MLSSSTPLGKPKHEVSAISLQKPVKPGSGSNSGMLKSQQSQRSLGIIKVSMILCITSDTLKCRSFLAQLGARMRNLRPCDNGKFPFQFDLRGQSVRACTV